MWLADGRYIWLSDMFDLGLWYLFKINGVYDFDFGIENRWLNGEEETNNHIQM